MISEAALKQDPRVSEILELILQITSGNLEARLTPSERGDDLDALITGLNMLGEELSAAFDEVNSARDTLEERVAERTAELERMNKKLADLINDLEIRNHEMILIKEMGQLLQTSLTSGETYAALKESVPKLFAGWSGALYVYNASRNLLEASVTWGAEMSSNEAFAPEECRALRGGRVFQANDVRKGLTCQHVEQKTRRAEYNAPLPTGSMCVPMMAHGETIGIFYLQTTREVDLLSAKRPLAETVSEQIALALANLRLRQTLKYQSIRDPLTGLFNRRYLEESLSRELSRAARKRHTISVIMFDIDHFKDFNDMHGHDAGDAVLQKLGTFLLQQSRNEDIICRYGGEEFTLIMLETTVEVACKRAEALREAVKQLDVYHRGNLLSKCTLSLGVATFPDQGNDVETILKAADQALYRAKREGRDRVVAAY